MHPKSNTITWFSRSTKQRRVVEVTSVALLHLPGEREAGRITVVFEDGPHRCRISLVRQPDRKFRGTCEKFTRDSDRPIRSEPLSCILLDSLETHALTLSMSPWVDEGQDESDWMGHFKNVQRVVCSEG
jgi:hypothetical protein